MFGLTEWKQTRFYQEVKAEGKAEGREEMQLEAIPRMLELGLSIEQIARSLDVDVETVRKFRNPRSRTHRA